MQITWAQFVWAAGLFLLWNGFLVGVIRVLISREVKSFEQRLADAETKAVKAAGSAAEAKQYISEEFSKLRLELASRTGCSNHQRIEDNDEKLFERFDQLHGDIRELVGGVKALANSVELLNTHHLNGGR